MTVERDAAPAGWFRKPALGRPRPAVRPHYDGLPSMAGRAGHERRREPPGWRSPKGFSDAPTRKHGLRGQKSRWWRAERRRAFEKNARTKQYGRAAWRATPSIVSGGRKGKAACPGPQTIRAAKRWLFASDVSRSPALTHDEISDDQQIEQIGADADGESRRVIAEMVVQQSGEPAASGHADGGEQQQRRDSP